MRRSSLLIAWLVAQFSSMALGAETDIAPVAAESAAAHPQPTVEPPPARLDTGPRFRFGIGLIAGLTLADEEVDGNLIAAVGLDLRLGVQIDDLFAVLCQASAALLELRAAVLFEVTPNRYFSAGVGIGVHHLPIGVFEEAPPADTDAVIVPVRLAFNLPLSAYARKNRTAISLEANLMPGFVYAGLPVEYGQRFEFGILGGLGFELY
jgi:hypothetical protein